MHDSDIDELIELCSYTRADYIKAAIACLPVILLLIWMTARI